MVFGGGKGMSGRTIMRSKFYEIYKVRFIKVIKCCQLSQGIFMRFEYDLSKVNCKQLIEDKSGSEQFCLEYPVSSLHLLLNFSCLVNK